VGARVGEHRGRAGALEVGAPGRLVEVAQRPARAAVLDRDHAPTLAVAAARREARGVEHPHQHLACDGVRPKAPRRRRVAHDLVEVHAGDDTSCSARQQAARQETGLRP
jgi:hypothetical protein